MTLNPKSELAAAIAERKDKAAYRGAKISLITEIAIVLIALFIIFTSVFGFYVVKGQDMYPALKDGDVVLYFRTHKLVNTEACVYRTDDGLRAGRVEATGGTTVSATGDLQMTFNGNYLPISKADGIYGKTYALEGTQFPFKIKEGNYFILGDNRDEAIDSRKYGQINRKSVKGRIVTVLRRRQI